LTPQYTPSIKLSILDDPQTNLKTEYTERTNVSIFLRQVSVNSRSFEADLVRENSHLKEENRLLREEAEYLRHKYTGTLIRKYRPGSKELFD